MKILSFCHHFDITNYKNYYSLEGKVENRARREAKLRLQRYMATCFPLCPFDRFSPLFPFSTSNDKIWTKMKIISFCHNFKITYFKNYYSLEGKVEKRARRKAKLRLQRYMATCFPLCSFDRFFPRIPFLPRYGTY